MNFSDCLRGTAYVALVGVCAHVAHAPFVPPYKREEHGEEHQPLRATDTGINLPSVVNFASGSVAREAGHMMMPTNYYDINRS